MSLSFETDPTLDSLAEVAIAKTQELIRTSDALRDRREKANRKRFARLLKDPEAIAVTITLTDEVMRIRSTKDSVKIFRQAATKATSKGFGPLNSVGLHILRFCSHPFPTPVLKLVHFQVRRLSQDLILPAEQAPLRRHLEHRAAQNIKLNINVLGEAVLGETEANERFKKIIEMMERPEVTYISVKLSAIVSQIITIDVDGTVERVNEKLRQIYRTAEAQNTFINLDMEEYRDLAMTVDAFIAVLSEPEFEKVNAGIVLQSYLPESHQACERLVNWSKERFTRTGAHIKIRLVKGANLAMEKAEAELHGWTPAPFPSKAHVDASYTRLIDLSLRKENAGSVRIGIASHNLFHVTWAIEVAKSRDVLSQLDIEMLEGMANSEALAVTKAGHQVLLYAPVTMKDDFASAVAYLVRRLDENTSDENYLKATFEIGSNISKFDEQKLRFKNSISERHALATQSLRHSIFDEKIQSGIFTNDASADPTLPTFIKAIEGELTKLQSASLAEPAITTERKTVDDVIARAREAQRDWRNLSKSDRAALLNSAADVMHKERSKTIALMANEAGKTVAESDPEISEAIDFARYYATFTNDIQSSTPKGTVLVIPPWNFPYAIPAGGVFAALAAGNTVILKPAPETRKTAFLLATQLWQAGIPTDVLQFIATPDDEVGKHLVTHTGIDAVILTGSFETAALFTSWKPDINLLAETSGKNAILISACADIDAAVKDLVQSAFGHAGQKCSAASLAIVDASVAGDPLFIHQLKDATESLAVGLGSTLSTTMGPIIHAPEASLTRALTTLDEGESWLVKPRQLDESATLWSPGIKMGVQPGSWSHRNEWFGPVLAVMAAPDFETALAWQNEVDFGLTAGISSLNVDECQQWIDSVQAGNLYVNRGITGAIVNRQPFGGWKRSAVGPTAKAGGPNYVIALSDWPELTDLNQATESLIHWWHDQGSKSLDPSNLVVEKNYHRYRHYLKPLVVRIDEGFTAKAAAYLLTIIKITGATIQLSSATSLDLPLDGLLTVEPLETLCARINTFGKVRWLSAEEAPAMEFLNAGISTDRRPLVGQGNIEGARWLLEQSIAITYHRYGNPNGGPKPIAFGLGS